MKINKFDNEFFLLNEMYYKINDHSYIFLDNKFDIFNKYTGQSLYSNGLHFKNIEINNLFSKTISDFAEEVRDIFSTVL